jgi:hypothetical protein
MVSKRLFTLLYRGCRLRTQVAMSSGKNLAHNSSLAISMHLSLGISPNEIVKKDKKIMHSSFILKE